MSSASTTRKRGPGRMNRSVQPLARSHGRRPAGGRVSSVRTVVVPTATTRRPRAARALIAAAVAAGTSNRSARIRCSASRRRGRAGRCRADVQRHRGAARRRGPRARRAARREVQAGRRRGDGAGRARVDGLVARPVRAAGLRGLGGCTAAAAAARAPRGTSRPARAIEPEARPAQLLPGGDRRARGPIGEENGGPDWTVTGRAEEGRPLVPRPREAAGPPRRARAPRSAPGAARAEPVCRSRRGSLRPGARRPAPGPASPGGARRAGRQRAVARRPGTPSAPGRSGPAAACSRTARALPGPGPR